MSTTKDEKNTLKLNRELIEALQNMVGMFDTPLTRRRIGAAWKDDWHGEACLSARRILNKVKQETI